MRRLASAAACGMLLLAACSEQPQSPTEQSIPSAAEPALASCRPVKFPTPTINSLINQVFPPGANRLEALARAAAVALLWDACKVEAARKSAVNFVQWIDLRAPSSANPAKVAALKAAILNAVGIPVTAPPPGFSDDFGAGIFDPTSTTETLIKTKSGRALVQLDPGSFNELTVITLSRKADDFQLTNFDGNQFPPKYDYDAVNASGNKILQNGKTAIVAFCLIGLDDVKFPGGYPEHPRIGHNPVSGAPGFPFEVLDEVNLAAEGLDDDLSPTVCGYTPVIGFGGGPVEFAKAVFRSATDLLLPEPLMAAAIMGTLPPPPPIGGRAGSLSPFGVVEFTPNQVEPFGSAIGPEDGNTVGTPLNTCSNDGCPVRFRISDGEVPITTPTNVTVTLIKEEGSTGTLSGTKTKSTSASSPYTADFDDLIISEPGTYRLKATASGATSYTTGSFSVTIGFAPNNLISSGTFFSCAAKFDGSVVCWGDNLQGQTTVPEGLTDVMSVESNPGAAHTCAVKYDGTVSCWGRSSEGQTTVPEGLNSVAAVAVGGVHSCALKTDGTLSCWGADDRPRDHVIVPEGLSDVVAVSAGAVVTCALKSNGTLTCWGSDQYGQLPLPAGLGPLKAVDVGDVHTCVLKTNGTVQCWGNNDSGETDVPPGLTDVVSVGAGEAHTCALKSDGTITCWGDNSVDQTKVPTGLTAKALSVGHTHNCALKADGSVSCWGWNNAGQLDVPEGLNLGPPPTP